MRLQPEPALYHVSRPARLHDPKRKESAICTTTHVSKANKRALRKEGMRGGAQTNAFKKGYAQTLRLIGV